MVYYQRMGKREKLAVRDIRLELPRTMWIKFDAWRFSNGIKTVRDGVRQLISEKIESEEE